MDLAALVEGQTDSEFVNDRFRAWCYENPGLAARMAIFDDATQRDLFARIYRKGCSDMLRTTSRLSPGFMALGRYVDFVREDEPPLPADVSSRR